MTTQLDWLRQRDKQVLRKTSAEEIIKELLNQEPVKKAARQGNIKIIIKDSKAVVKTAINNRTIATFNSKIKNAPNISVNARLISQNGRDKYQLLLRDRDQERLYGKLTAVNQLKNSPENNLPSVSFWSKKLDRKLMFRVNKRAKSPLGKSIRNTINHTLLDKRVVKYAINAPVDIRISNGKLKIYSTTTASNRALYIIDTKVSRLIPDITIRATFKGERIYQDRFKDLEKGLSFELRLNNESKARLIAGEMGDISHYDNLGHYQKIDKVVRSKHKLNDNSQLTENWINKQAASYIQEFIHQYQTSAEVKEQFNSKVTPFSPHKKISNLASSIITEKAYQLTEKAKFFISELKCIAEKYLTLKTTRQLIYDSSKENVKVQATVGQKIERLPYLGKELMTEHHLEKDKNIYQAPPNPFTNNSIAKQQEHKHQKNRGRER